MSTQRSWAFKSFVKKSRYVKNDVDEIFRIFYSPSRIVKNLAEEMSKNN